MPSFPALFSIRRSEKRITFLKTVITWVLPPHVLPFQSVKLDMIWKHLLLLFYCWHWLILLAVLGLRVIDGVRSCRLNRQVKMLILCERPQLLLPVSQRDVVCYLHEHLLWFPQLTCSSGFKRKQWTHTHKKIVWYLNDICLSRHIGHYALIKKLHINLINAH